MRIDPDVLRRYFHKEDIVYFYNEDTFESFLKLKARHFNVVPTSNLAYLKVGSDWRTVEGSYRYSYRALTEICRLLCSSFIAVLFDFLGVIAGASVPNKESNVEAATRFFNIMLQERQEVLKSYDLLVDTENKIIVGLLSKTHLSELKVDSLFNLVKDNCNRLGYGSFNYAAWDNGVFWNTYSKENLEECFSSEALYGVFSVIKGSGTRCTKAVCFDKFALLDKFTIKGHGTKGHTKQYSKKLANAFDMCLVTDLDKKVKNIVESCKSIELFEVFPYFKYLIEDTVSEKQRSRLKLDIENFSSYKDTSAIFTKAVAVCGSLPKLNTELTLHDYINSVATLARDLPLLQEEHVMCSLFSVLGNPQIK